jgi:hypothetical protein
MPIRVIPRQASRAAGSGSPQSRWFRFTDDDANSRVSTWFRYQVTRPPTETAICFHQVLLMGPSRGTAEFWLVNISAHRRHLSAHRRHLSAMRFHVATLSGARVNLAICSHSRRVSGIHQLDAPAISRGSCNTTMRTLGKFHPANVSDANSGTTLDPRG